MILEMTNEKLGMLLLEPEFYEFSKEFYALCTETAKSGTTLNSGPFKKAFYQITINDVRKKGDFEKVYNIVGLDVREASHDWEELKAFAITVYNDKYLFDHKKMQTLLDIGPIEKYKKKKSDSEDDENSYFTDFWDYFDNGYKGTSPFKNCKVVNNPDMALSDYAKEFSFIKNLKSVPPYPSFNILKLQLEGSGNDNRALRAEVVSDYIKEHPANDELKIVLTKFALVDTLYHGQLEKKVNYEEMARLITGESFKPRTGKSIDPIELDMNDLGNKSLEEIANIVDILRFRSVNLELDPKKIGTRKGELSPVTKYIHCHEPKYPIWDRNVNDILFAWYKYYGTIDEFTHKTNELKYYEAYKNYIDSVRDYFNSIKTDDDVKDLAPDEFDSALWILGGKYK